MADSDQIDKLLNRFRSLCASPKSFRSGFDVAQGHILQRAAETGQPVRSAIVGNSELMASLILHGQVLHARCKLGSQPEVVFEGRFLDLAVTEWMPEIKEIYVPEVAVRLVAKEARPKNVILSVHQVTDMGDTSNIPEVPKDVWKK